MAFPATSPLVPPVNFTRTGRSGRPIPPPAWRLGEFDHAGGGHPYPCVDPHLPWLDMMPDPEDVARWRRAAIDSIMESCMFSSGPSSIGSSSP